MKQFFLFIGPPGSGKWTQANFLVKKFGLEYIETGQLLRNYQKNKNFSGKKLITVMNRGDLAPSFFVVMLWLKELERLKNFQSIKGFVLDGVCRKLMEAEILDQALKWYEWDKKIKVIFINISRKESIWRLSKRRICKKCQRNIPYLGSLRLIKICDQCGGELKIRDDDNKNAIIKRLENFNKKTLPVIDFFEKQGKLIKINGEQSIDNVFKEILKKISNF